MRSAQQALVITRMTLRRGAARGHTTCAVICTSLAVLLSGCGDSGYEKKNGQWQYDGNPVPMKQGGKLKPLAGPFAKDAQFGYYRGAPIPGSDGPSFQPLDNHYARDRSQVYFCDTYRKGQEYYIQKHNHVVVLEGVSLDSFRPLKNGYARDATRLYYEGAHIAVKDLETFEELEDRDYQRDRVTGYFRRRPIADSDGSTFEVLGAGYSKDKTKVFFSHYRPSDAALEHKTIRVAGASPASFSVMRGGYAKDSKQVYHNGIVLTKDTASFELLASVYAKTASAVYYDGKRIAGADASTFVVLEAQEGEADAKDARRSYRGGEPITGARIEKAR